MHDPQRFSPHYSAHTDFDKVVAIQRARREAEKNSAKRGRLTGRQMFEQGKLVDVDMDMADAQEEDEGDFELPEYEGGEFEMPLEDEETGASSSAAIPST